MRGSQEFHERLSQMRGRDRVKNLKWSFRGSSLDGEKWDTVIVVEINYFLVCFVFASSDSLVLFSPLRTRDDNLGRSMNKAHYCVSLSLQVLDRDEDQDAGTFQDASWHRASEPHAVWVRGVCW